MAHKDPAAVALGRKGGLAGKGRTSPAKAASSRENGKRGGRPAANRKIESHMTITSQQDTWDADAHHTKAQARARRKDIADAKRAIAHLTPDERAQQRADEWAVLLSGAKAKGPHA